MNQFKRSLAKLPELRQEVGPLVLDKHLVSFHLLTKELDVELDGVSLPASAAAIINRLRSINTEIEL